RSRRAKLAIQLQEAVMQSDFTHSTVAADELAPLRERWPQILAYPVQGAALSTIVAIAIAHLVLYLPWGWILDLIVWASFFQYAFEVLRWTANGREQAPEFAFSVSAGVARYAVLLLVLVNLVVALLMLTANPTLAFAFGAVCMFAMPAVMMILALEEGMVRALNPFAWLLIGA